VSHNVTYELLMSWLYIVHVMHALMTYKTYLYYD